MDNITTKRYEMLKRVRDFGVAQTAAFPDGSFGKELFAAVAQSVAKLDSQSANQSSGRGEAQSIASTKSATRVDLREMIKAINRTAAVIAFETPGLENKFRLPRGTNDQALLNAARAFAADAVPLKAAFLKHEMPADFIERLNQLIADFEQVSTQKAAAVGSHVAAKISIDETVASGLQAVQQLDVIIRNKFNGDPATLAN
ncbi:MAG: hypothetical protein ACRD82_13880 [Blastocatellia bacterium]